MQEDEIFDARIRELAQAAAVRGCFLFTDFLNPAQLSRVLNREKLFPVSVVCSGGYADAERVMARFGSPEELGYEEPFPIAILQISPLNAKFSDRLTHRDYLGAVLNLGIDRRLTGDILTDGTDGWIFVQEHIVPFFEESLTRVKHTSVRAVRTRELPAGILRKPETVSVIVPSLRADAVISKMYALSRKDVQALFTSEKILVNSRIAAKSTHLLQEGDLVSVRGHGRFRYICTEGDTRKGNLKITAERF